MTLVFAEDPDGEQNQGHRSRSYDRCSSGQLMRNWSSLASNPELGFVCTQPAALSLLLLRLV